MVSVMSVMIVRSSYIDYLCLGGEKNPPIALIHFKHQMSRNRIPIYTSFITIS